MAQASHGLAHGLRVGPGVFRGIMAGSLPAVFRPGLFRPSRSSRWRRPTRVLHGELLGACARLAGAVRPLCIERGCWRPRCWHGSIPPYAPSRRTSSCFFNPSFFFFFFLGVKKKKGAPHARSMPHRARRGSPNCAPAPSFHSAIAHRALRQRPQRRVNPGCRSRLPEPGSFGGTVR